MEIDAAGLVKAMRDHVVTLPGVECASRQRGTPFVSTIDVVTDDRRRYLVTIVEVGIDAWGS